MERLKRFLVILTAAVMLNSVGSRAEYGAEEIPEDVTEMLLRFGRAAVAVASLLVRAVQPCCSYRQRSASSLCFRRVA